MRDKTWLVVRRKFISDDPSIFCHISPQAYNPINNKNWKELMETRAVSNQTLKISITSFTENNLR